MAEALDIEAKQSMSGTLVAGSEEDFDTVCEFCHGEGKRVEADGYCLDCREYFCKNCKTNHKKTSATKNHVLKDNLAMSMKADGAKHFTGPPDATDPLIDRCPKHPDEIIKFYCNQHKALGCSVCVPLHHRTCEDISYIRDVSSGIAESDEFKNIQADIKKFLAGLECSKIRSEWSRRETGDSYNQLVADVKLLRQNINQLLDTLEEELLNKAALLKREHLDSLSDQTLKYEGLHDILTEISTNFENKRGQKHFNQLYISMKSVMERVQVLEKEAVGFIQTIRPGRFVFRRDDILGNITSSLTSLGTVSLDVESSEDLRAKYLHDISIMSNTDTSHCNANGIAVLHDGRIALSDYTNKSVKIADVESRNISEEISLTTSPTDLALIGDDQLAVTLKGEKYIQLLSLSPTLSASHTIAMPGCYNGITFSEGKLTMACYKPSSVHICDISGNLLQIIVTDNTGNTLFSGAPSKITTSPDQSIIYVNCRKSNGTTCLSNNGIVMATYVNDRLKNPKGMAVDEYGRVYVCSRDTHTVHQLTPMGQLIKIILEGKDGIKFPYAITYSAGQLYISCNSTSPALCNNIKVYKLE